MTISKMVVSQPCLSSDRLSVSPCVPWGDCFVQIHYLHCVSVFVTGTFLFCCVSGKLTWELGTRNFKHQSTPVETYSGWVSLHITALSDQ